MAAILVDKVICGITATSASLTRFALATRMVRNAPALRVTNGCNTRRLNNKGRLRALYYLIPKVTPLTAVTA